MGYEKRKSQQCVLRRPAAWDPENMAHLRLDGCRLRTVDRSEGTLTNRTSGPRKPQQPPTTNTPQTVRCNWTRSLGWDRKPTRIRPCAEAQESTQWEQGEPKPLGLFPGPGSPAPRRFLGPDFASRPTWSTLWSCRQGKVIWGPENVIQAGGRTVPSLVRNRVARPQRRGALSIFTRNLHARRRGLPRDLAGRPRGGLAQISRRRGAPGGAF